MSLSTYAGLRTALVNFLLNDAVGSNSISSTDADDLITLAEARINKEVRHKHMEKALSGTIASGVLTVPSDFVALKFAYIATTPVQVLIPSTSDQIFLQYPNRSSTDVPKYIARDVTNFVFGPFPDGNYSVGGTYYYRFSALSSALNSLFSDHPDLYLFAALAEAAPFVGYDQRMPLWEAKYARILEAVNKEENQSRHSGGPLQVKAIY